MKTETSAIDTAEIKKSKGDHHFASPHSRKLEPIASISDAVPESQNVDNFAYLRQMQQQQQNDDNETAQDNYSESKKLINNKKSKVFFLLIWLIISNSYFIQKYKEKKSNKSNETKAQKSEKFYKFRYNEDEHQIECMINVK